MEYSYISFDELLDLRKRGLADISLGHYNLNKEEIEKIYVSVCHNVSHNNNLEKIYGLCIGVVYKPNTMSRCSQWRFGENKYRELYITDLYTELNSECKGSVLLSNVESKLKSHKDSVLRKNIYVISVFEAFSFYENCGYTEIDTPEDDDDEDYPSAFTDGACVGTWMAKPINDELDNECVPNYIIEYLFRDAWGRNSYKMLQKYLTFDVDLSLIWFLWSHDYEKFKQQTRRKYMNLTIEQFIEKYYEQYSDFITAMNQYNTNTNNGRNVTKADIQKISKYFRNLNEEDLKLVLKDYFYELEFCSLYGMVSV